MPTPHRFVPAIATFCAVIGIACVAYLTLVVPDSDYAPLEVHWISLGENGASGYVKNVSDHVVNGFCLKVTATPGFVVNDLTLVNDFATFPASPSAKCVLAPQQTMPFTVSSQYLGPLHWPPTITLMDATGNDLGSVQQEYRGQRASDSESPGT